MADEYFATSEYLEYKTIDDERWDQIAYKFYGIPTLYEPIIRANPYIPITSILPAGTIIQIPILQEDELDAQDKGDLPPWL